MTATTAPELRRLDRAAVQRFLPQLDRWLLPDALYGVQHTWPQLYRSDGDGRFLGLFAEDRLLSHCAWRLQHASTAAGRRRIALLGSVATDPAERGRGHASRLLRAAMLDARQGGAEAVLLWAERPELYARAGFRPGALEDVLLLQPGTAPPAAVRLATIADHAALHALHERKPLRIARDLRTMSGLLTTPGLWTFVLERGGAIVAYACCGKGADLQNWWHELGGADADVALLLPAALPALHQDAAFLLLPPYRPALPGLLASAVADRVQVAGPMLADLGPAPLPATWIDGLDSV